MKGVVHMLPEDGVALCGERLIPIKNETQKGFYDRLLRMEDAEDMDGGYNQCSKCVEIWENANG